MDKMNFKRIILSGHSMGGYIATKFAYKHPEKIISLSLMSPGGLWSMPPEFMTKVQGILDSYGFIQRTIYSKTLNGWAPGKSPMGILRYFGRLTNLFFKSYMKDYPKLTSGERDDIKNYLFQITMKPGSGEYAMPYLLLPV